MASRVPFNPSWHGWAPAGDRQIAGGAAPFAYQHLPHDSAACVAAKSLFNAAHAAVYAPAGPPVSAVVGAGLAVRAAEDAVAGACLPSFSVDTYQALGMPPPAFT